MYSDDFQASGEKPCLPKEQREKSSAIKIFGNEQHEFISNILTLKESETKTTR